MTTRKQAANLLGTFESSKSDARKCTYIPLISLRNENKTSKTYVREIESDFKNLNFLFDSSKYIEYRACPVSQNTHVNSSENKLSQSGSFTGFQAINGFFPSLRCACTAKVTINDWAADEYRSAETEILSTIKYAYRRSLIVWCPTSDLESELFHVWIKKSGNTVCVYDRWIQKDAPYEKTLWGGAVVVYPSRRIAKMAAEEIPLQHETFKVITLSELIHSFIKSELKYFSEEKTQVVVHAKTSGRENIQTIEAALHRFGHVEFCGFDYVIINAAVVFEVIYTFSTHAFLAKTVLDGLPFGSGLLDVEIKLTSKMKAIFEEFRLQLTKVIGDVYFPF